MGGNMIVNQVCGIILKGIEKFEKEFNSSKIALYIYAKNLRGTPGLFLFVDNKKHSEIEWSNLLQSKGQKFLYQAMGFNFDKDVPRWIERFLVKSAFDHDVLTTEAGYMIVKNNSVTSKEDKERLTASMIVKGKCFKNISIDYIVETD